MLGTGPIYDFFLGLGPVPIMTFYYAWDQSQSWIFLMFGTGPNRDFLLCLGLVSILTFSFARDRYHWWLVSLVTFPYSDIWQSYEPSSQKIWPFSPFERFYCRALYHLSIFPISWPSCHIFTDASLDTHIHMTYVRHLSSVIADIWHYWHISDVSDDRWQT